MIKDDIIPHEAVPVDISVTDFDCTTVFVSSRYARRIFVGSKGTIYVKYFGYDVAIPYVKGNGTYLDGKISTVVRSGTTASDIVAET